MIRHRWKPMISKRMTFEQLLFEQLLRLVNSRTNRYELNQLKQHQSQPKFSSSLTGSPEDRIHIFSALDL